MGAVDARGTYLLDEQVVRALHLTGERVGRLVAAARDEAVRRERVYRPDRPPLALSGKIAVLVDDGLATGFTMAAAVAAARAAGAIHIVVAVPVAARDTAERMRRLADSCVCVQEVEPLYGVGAWYHDFRQLGDEEVCRILDRERNDAAPSTTGEHGGFTNSVRSPVLPPGRRDHPTSLAAGGPDDDDRTA